jgi:hypothetical protein
LDYSALLKDDKQKDKKEKVSFGEKLAKAFGTSVDDSSVKVKGSITQTAAYIGANIDLATQVTVPNSSSGNQTGISLTEASREVSAAAPDLEDP